MDRPPAPGVWGGGQLWPPNQESDSSPLISKTQGRSDLVTTRRLPEERPRPGQEGAHRDGVGACPSSPEPRAPQGLCPAGRADCEVVMESNIRPPPQVS